MTMRRSPEEFQSLASLWNDGLPTPEIAAFFGVSESSIRNVAHRMGLAKRSIQRGDSNLPTPWTGERTDRLRTLWGEGYSATYIADDLGETTRSGVLGKVHRLGLAKRRTVPTVQRGKSRRVRRRRVTAQAVQCPGLSDSLSTPLIDDLAIPEAQRRTILQLTNDTCHWPVGHPNEPGFFFCGAKTDGAHSYCRAHKRIAYTVPPKSRRPANFALQKPWMMAEAE